MRRILSIILIGCFSLHVSAQVLKCDPLSDEERIVFNTEYIKENSISEVSIEGQIKKRGEGIYSTGKIEKISFDQKGRLASKSVLESGDTTWTQLFRTTYEKDLKSKEVRTQSVGTAVYDFSYGPNGDLLEITSGKSSNFDSIENTEDYTYIGVERFEWVQVSDIEKQKKVLNSLGKPYMKVTYTFDSTGVYLLEIKQTYILTKRSSKVFFEYDEMGRLAKEIDGEEISVFTYDQWNNVLSEVCFEGDEEKYRKEFVYDSKGKLSGRLMKYVYSPTVYIDKYTYEFESPHK